jgi:hypothetical protein
LSQVFSLYLALDVILDVDLDAVVGLEELGGSVRRVTRLQDEGEGELGAARRQAAGGNENPNGDGRN